MFKKFRHSVSHKVLFGVVAIGLILTTITTAVIAFVDYKSEMGNLERKFDSINDSFLGSLALSLWAYDDLQIKEIADSIIEQPDIVYIRILDSDNEETVFESGKKPLKSFQLKEFDLKTKGDGNTVEKVGIIRIYASLKMINERVIGKALLLIFSQSVKTLFASMLIIMLVNFLIKNHLFSMKNFLDTFDPKEKKFKKLELNGRHPRYNDEIDILANSINYMCLNLSKLYSEMESNIEDRTRQLKEKQKSTQALFESLPLGVLSINSEGAINPEYSKLSTQILGVEDISDKSFEEIVMKKIDLMPEKKSMLMSSIEACMGEDEVNFDLNEHNLLDELTLNSNNKVKYLDTTWSYVTDDYYKISKIIFTFKDKTEMMILTQKEQHRSLELEIINQLLQNPPEKLNQLMNATLNLVEKIEKINLGNEEIVNEIMKDLHTMKGNTRVFNLSYLSNEFHNMESTLSDNMADSDTFHDSLGNLRKIFDLYMEKGVQLKILSNFEQTPIEYSNLRVKKSSLRVLDNVYNKLVNSKIVFNMNDVYDLVNGFQESRARDIKSMLKPIMDESSNIASQLDKHPPIFDFKGPKILFFDDFEAQLISSFGHLIRNSLDHGIESIDERLKSNKKPSGTISFELRSSDDHVYVIYCDDGRGLNLKRLKEKGIDRKLIAENASDQEVAELIFSPQFSSRDEVTTVSGRGVGMDAVKDIFNSIGGSIKLVLDVRSSREDYCKFSVEICLPKNVSYQSIFPENFEKAV